MSPSQGVKRVEDLIAFQRAVLFKEGIYAIVRSNPQAMRDWKWRDQIFDAAASVEANIAEGWGAGARHNSASSSTTRMPHSTKRSAA